MQKYNKQNQKSFESLLEDRKSLFNPINQQQTTQEAILNQLTDQQIESSLKSIEQNTKKIVDEVDNHQQDIVLKHAGETLSNVKSKLQATLNETNPQKILQDVKQQLTQNKDPPSKYNSPINIEGQLIPREQFRQTLQLYLGDYPYPEKGKQLFNKYAIFSKNHRILSSAEMEVNAAILLDKLRKYQSARDEVNHLLYRIQNQIYYLTQKPHQWYKWFLKKKGLKQNPVLYTKALQDEKLQAQQARTRLIQLNNKRDRIHTQLDNYVRRANKLRNNNIQEYAKMMDVKDQLHTAQKSVLTFLIEKKGEEVMNLNNQIQKEQNDFNEYKTSVNTQITQWQKQRQNKEDELNKEIIEIKNTANKEKQLINQQKEQEKKLKLQLQQKKAEQQRIITEMNNRIQTQNQLVNQYQIQKENQKLSLINQLTLKDNLLKQKVIEEKAIIKQLDEKTKSEAILIEQQKRIIDELRNRDRMLMQKSKYQSELITYQQNLLNENKKAEISLQQKLQQEINLRRKQDELLAQIQHQKNINKKNAEIAQLRMEEKQKIQEANILLNQRAEKLASFNQESKEKINMLERQITKHKQDLKKMDEDYISQVSNLKQKMLQATASHTQILQDRQNLLRQAHSQYDNMRKMLQGREAQYQQYVKSLTNKLNQQIQEKSQILKNLDAVGQQNKHLQQQITVRLEELKKNAEQHILAARTLADDKGKALIKQKDQNNVLKSSLAELEKKDKKRQQIVQQRIVQYQKKMQTRIDSLEKQNKQLEEKLKEMGMELNLTQKKLKEMQETPEIFQLSYKYWWTEQTKLFTIRQCFRPTQKDKWIASTRGINFSQKQKKKIELVLSQWSLEKKPNFTKKIIEGTKIIEIIDEYKGKKFYSLRQIYYYGGMPEPTRRGFNIAEDDLDSFFKGINKMLKPSQLQN